MATQTQQKIVLATAVNYVVEVNEVLNNSTRIHKPANLTLPTMFDRAFLIFHEAGVLPFTQTVYSPGESQ